MSKTREEEFLAAVETIRSALRDGIVIKKEYHWGNPFGINIPVDNITLTNQLTSISGISHKEFWLIELSEVAKFRYEDAIREHATAVSNLEKADKAVRHWKDEVNG